MNKKRILATIAAMTVITASVAAQNVVIDEKTVSDAAYTDGDTLMLPLRSLGEGLGYQVEWDAATRGITLIKGAHYITLNIDADAYTFARMAPMPLRKAPVLSAEGVTFVPANFVTDILQKQYTISENGDIVVTEAPAVSDEEITEPVVISGTAVITEISENTITVEDIERGEVILNIGGETKLFDAEGNEIKADALEKDLKVEIEYSEAMTMSIPPQNTPVSVKISAEEATTETLEGEIRGFEEGMILVGGEAPQDRVALVVSEETKITDKDGNELKVEDLKEGDEITALHSRAMTFSIPPQTAAFEIIVK